MEASKGYSGGWIILELFGRQTLAGLASEQLIAGSTFLRLDVPEVDGVAGFTKFFGGSSIYAITPTTEEMAKAAVKRLQPRPVDPWILDMKQLTAPRSGIEGQPGWGDEEER